MLICESLANEEFFIEMPFIKMMMKIQKGKLSI